MSTKEHRMQSVYSAMSAALDAIGLDPNLENLAKGQNIRIGVIADPGDFEVDGIVMCGMCGKPKESVETGANGPVRFPIIHRHNLPQLNRRKLTPIEESERKDRNRRMCFSGEFREIGEKCSLGNAFQDTNPESIDLIERFGKSFFENRQKRIGRGLLISGDNGRGKTFIAGCACNLLLSNGYKVLMTSTRRIRSQVESSFGSLNRVIEWLTTFDCVCLDDFFRDRDTQASREVIFNVVDALYNNRVPMIITTNMSSDYIFHPKEEDIAVLDRIKERCERFELTGPNRRQEAAI